jgi:hypothetical protein
MGGKNNNSDRGGASDNTIYIGQSTNTGDNVDYDTSKATITKAFRDTKAKMQCCDKLFVYVTGHGGLYCKVTWENRITGAQSEEKKQTECPKVGDTSWGVWKAVKVEKDTYMTLDGEWLWGEELGRLLNTIDSCNTYVYLQACHSGGAMDWLKGKGRTIGTSADEDKSSWGQEGIGSDTTNALVDGLNGAAGSDLNGDGKTGIDEAMQYGRDNYKGKWASNDEKYNSNPQYWRSTEPCRCPEEICPPPVVENITIVPVNETLIRNDTVNETVITNDTIRNETIIFNETIIWEDDQDHDGIKDNVDNCPYYANPDQADSDGDHIGNACDACPQDAANDGDHDGVCGNVDNCPYVANPSQADNDGDGIGSACDSTPVNCQNEMDPEYTTVVAQGNDLTQSACQALLGEVGRPECFTTCAYAGYESWTWGPNHYACCYQDVNRYACSDCPGENPTCPDPNTVCTGANGPE